MNKKLERLEHEVATAQKRLDAYKSFLASREANPDFQVARRAYNAGWRIDGWTWQLTDTSNEIYVKNTKTGEHFYFADGTNRDTDEALVAIGITDVQAEMLSDLCEELE